MPSLVTAANTGKICCIRVDSTFKLSMCVTQTHFMAK
jgi:hypothetical protein